MLIGHILNVFFINITILAPNKWLFFLSLSRFKYPHFLLAHMKIMAFSDVHADLEIARCLVKRAQKKDIELIVCAGDFTVFERQLKPMLKLFNSIGKPVVLIPGNHEEPTAVEKYISDCKHIAFIHKKIWRYNGFTFLGWGTDGFTKRSEEFRMVARKWRQKLTADDTTIVLVTHAPPHGTMLDKLDKEHIGNKDIRTAIEWIQPVLAISGHIHENEGRRDKIGKTVAVNPGWKGMVLTV